MNLEAGMDRKELLSRPMARYGQAGAAVSTRYRFLGPLLLPVAPIRIECVHFGANTYVSPVDSCTQTWVYASGICAQALETCMLESLRAASDSRQTDVFPRARTWAYRIDRVTVVWICLITVSRVAFWSYA